MTNNFDYIQGIPAANDNPSDDQPDMLINTNSNYSIWDVDHIGFGQNNGGEHNQVTFPNINPTIIAPTGTASVVYSNDQLSQVSGNPNLVFQTANGTVSVSLIKAWANFVGSTGGLNQNQNLASVVRNSVGNYTINLNSNIVNTTNYSVYATGSSPNTIFGYVFNATSSTQFTLKTVSLPTGTLFDFATVGFIVIQQ